MTYREPGKHRKEENTINRGPYGFPGNPSNNVRFRAVNLRAVASTGGNPTASGSSINYIYVKYDGNDVYLYDSTGSHQITGAAVPPGKTFNIYVGVTANREDDNQAWGIGLTIKSTNGQLKGWSFKQVGNLPGFSKAHTIDFQVDNVIAGGSGNIFTMPTTDVTLSVKCWGHNDPDALVTDIPDSSW